MPKDIAGIICAGGEEEELRTLVSKRNIASLPIGGRYRMVDFLLSNMVNSNISSIGILARKNCRSILDHVGAGKEWDLDRKNGGLFVLPPAEHNETINNPVGMLDELKNAQSFIEKRRQSYVLLCNADVLYNNIYDDMYNQHIETGADITIMYDVSPFKNKPSVMEVDRFVLHMDDNSRITDIQYTTSEKAPVCQSMGCIIMPKQLLLHFLESEYSFNKHNTFVDTIKKNLNELKVYGYKHEGYSARITNVSNYFSTSMDMLKPEVLQDLFYTGNNVYTKTKDESPALYGDDAVVENSMIASGCLIEGTVENSIVFRGVHIAKGVKIKDSVIMQNSVINENAVLDKVILDKNVTVSANSNLVGTATYPVVIPKGGIV